MKQNQTTKTEEKRKPGSGGMSQHNFMIAMTTFSLLCIPYFYQAISINTLIHADPNKGNHEYPKLSDLWIVLVGALAFNIWERASDVILYPIFAPLTKGDGDEQLKKFYTKKAIRTCWQVQYFTFAAIWGYSVLKPTGWLCWEIGGEMSITEVWKITMAEVPYLKCPRPVLIYALGTMGYHFGDSVN